MAIAPLQLLRYAWALPATLPGLLLAAVAIGYGATARRVDGVLEVAGGRLARASLPFIGITFGHVVLGLSHATLAEHRVHEHTHVRQYERWGVLFFPLYLGASLLAWARGQRPYRDNPFEQEACHAARLAASRPDFRQRAPRRRP